MVGRIQQMPEDEAFSGETVLAPDADIEEAELERDHYKPQDGGEQARERTGPPTGTTIPATTAAVDDEAAGGEAETAATDADRSEADHRPARLQFSARPIDWNERARRLIPVAILLAVTAGVLALGIWRATPSAADLGDDCETAGLIFDVEIAATRGAFDARLAGCDATALEDALRWDMLFALLYGVVLWKAAPHFATLGYRMASLRSIGKVMGFAGLVAAGFDIVENAALLIGLHTDAPSAVFGVAAVFAWAKFIVAAIVIGYVLVGVIGSLTMPAWLLAAYGDMRATPAPEPTQSGHATKPVGIAVSGGGVRSASFALGGLQAADGEHLGFDSARHVAAVSGGGYMVGAWTTGRLGPDAQDRIDGASDWLKPWAAPDGDNRADSSISPEETHLRNRLNYLLDADDGRPEAVPTVVFGFLVNTLIFSLSLYLVARPLGWLLGWLHEPLTIEFDQPGRRYGWPYQLWLPPVAWAGLGLGILIGWVLSARVARTSDRTRKFRDWMHENLRPVAYGALAIAGVLAAVLVAAPIAMIEFPARVLTPASDGPADPTFAATAISLLGAAGITAAIRKVLQEQLASIQVRLGGYLLAFIAVIVGGWWATDAAIDGPNLWGWWSWGMWAIVALVVYAFANPDWWSLAPFYRGRLRTAYALRRPDDTPDGWRHADDYTGGAEPLLWDEAFRAQGLKPEFSCAVQVRDHRVATHAAIPALHMSVTTDEVTIHLPDIGGRDRRALSCKPEQLDAALWSFENPRLTTMFAVGLSGAAAAPSMGRLSLGSTRALLAFANVRLGIWIPNPRWARLIPTVDHHIRRNLVDLDDDARDATTREADRRSYIRPDFPRVGMSYLFKEMFGLHDLRDVYVHAADGGHWENTAITQLLSRTDLREVLALDASGGKPHATKEISEAINLVSLEYGRTIDIDIETIRSESDGTRGGATAPHQGTVGVIREAGKLIGLLWYTRPVMTEAASSELQAYAERDDVFPGDSTVNQFFDVERYEAYRRLGHENVSYVLRQRAELKRALLDPTRQSLAGFLSGANGNREAHAVKEVARLIKDGHREDLATLRSIIVA